MGWKDEEEGYATLSKKRIRVRRIHNALVNRFVRAIEWKFRLLESEFDIVVDEWQGNRKLLIEAKTLLSPFSFLLSCLLGTIAA